MCSLCYTTEGDDLVLCNSEHRHGFSISWAMVLAAILAPPALTLYSENAFQSSGRFVKPGSQGNVILHGFVHDISQTTSRAER